MATEAHKSLSLARTASKHLLAQADGIQSQQQAAELEHALAVLFLERFSLTESEVATLASKELSVGAPLFAVLDRLETIRREAQALLEGAISSSSDASRPRDARKVSTPGSAPGSNAGIRAGVDIMDTTSQQLDVGYTKLGRWLAFEFRQPVREGMEVSPVMREAVRRMHAGGRDDILKPALATLSATRASFLSTSFQMALTVGSAGPTETPRPIELQAHDPLRYIGDMLAWVHQALASEREFLTALFSAQEDEGGRRIGQRRRGLEGSLDFDVGGGRQTLQALGQEAREGTLTLSSSERATREMLDRNIDGCCRPLRTRVLQIIRSQEGSITTFKLANLIDFYRITITRTLGSRAALSRTLADLKAEALGSFTATLDKQAAGLGRYNESPLPDLSELPPPIVSAAYTLKELLSALRGSFVEEADDGSLDKQAREDAEKQLAMVTDKLVSPMLALSERVSKQIVDKRGRGKSEADARWEQCTFLCNCLDYLSEVLTHFPFAIAASTSVAAGVEQQLKSLEDKHSEALLAKSGLAGALAAAEGPADPSKQAALAQSLDALSSFLASDVLITPPSLAALSSHAMRSQVHRSALSRLADAYAKVVQAVEAQGTGSVLRQSEQEVRVLLGVDYRQRSN